MEVRIHRRDRGDYPVLDFIKKLPIKHQRKISSVLDKLKDKGHVYLLKTGDVKKLTRDIYELIVDYDNIFYRLPLFGDGW